MRTVAIIKARLSLATGAANTVCKAVYGTANRRRSRFFHRGWGRECQLSLYDDSIHSAQQVPHGEVPDAESLAAAKRQQRGGGIPLLVGASAVGSAAVVCMMLLLNVIL